MKLYRRVLGSTVTLGAAPGWAWSNRTASAIAVCKAVVKCFGIPTVDSQTIFQLLKYNILDDLSNSFATILGEAIASLGMAGFTNFGALFFLVSGVTNVPLVVPATMRWMLVLATDLILILVRAFRETAFRCIGQPLLKDGIYADFCCALQAANRVKRSDLLARSQLCGSAVSHCSLAKSVAFVDAF